MTRVAIVIPVGPEEHHALYLDECLASVYAQSRLADDVVIVDDMHGRGIEERMADPTSPGVVWAAPWHLGVGTAFNIGCALAFRRGADLAIMLGSDDLLEGECVQRLLQQYERDGETDGYYWFDVRYSTGEVQALPCNAAAVTPGFMRFTGGFPVEAASGAMDAALISAMMHRRGDLLRRIADGHVHGMYLARVHPQQETARLNAYFEANQLIRAKFTTEWREPTWGRYA